MKKLIFLSLIISLIVVSGCKKSAKDMLTGTWKLKAVDGETLTPEELKNTMTFTADGVMTTKSGVSDESQSGKWSIGAGDTTINAISPNGDTMMWQIETLDASIFAFSMKGESKKITMEKQ